MRIDLPTLLVKAEEEYQRKRRATNLIASALRKDGRLTTIEEEEVDVVGKEENTVRVGGASSPLVI